MTNNFKLMNGPNSSGAEMYDEEVNNEPVNQYGEQEYSHSPKHVEEPVEYPETKRVKRNYYEEYKAEVDPPMERNESSKQVDYEVIGENQDKETAQSTSKFSGNTTKESPSKSFSSAPKMVKINEGMSEISLCERKSLEVSVSPHNNS